MRNLSIVLLALSFAACAPSLESGVYTCKADSECPSGWTCRFGELCYESAPSNLALYAHCERNAECASGTCYLGFNDNSSSGFCSESCTPNGPQTCPDDGLCVLDRQCVAPCTNDDQCPGTMKCVPALGAMGRTCMDVDDPSLESRMGCSTTNSNCPSPLVCLLSTSATYGLIGACVYPCGMEGVDSCPMDGKCMAIRASMPVTPSMTTAACLQPCMNNNECTSGLTCVAYPGPEKHCVPPLWVNAP